jgi:hypothetical protein
MTTPGKLTPSTRTPTSRRPTTSSVTNRLSTSARVSESLSTGTARTGTTRLSGPPEEGLSHAVAAAVEKNKFGCCPRCQSLYRGSSVGHSRFSFCLVCLLVVGVGLFGVGFDGFGFVLAIGFLVVGVSIELDVSVDLDIVFVVRRFDRRVLGISPQVRNDASDLLHGLDRGIRPPDDCLAESRYSGSNPHSEGPAAYRRNSRFFPRCRAVARSRKPYRTRCHCRVTNRPRSSPPLVCWGPASHRFRSNLRYVGPRQKPSIGHHVRSQYGGLCPLSVRSTPTCSLLGSDRGRYTPHSREGGGMRSYLYHRENTGDRSRPIPISPCLIRLTTMCVFGYRSKDSIGSTGRENEDFPS